MKNFEAHLITNKSNILYLSNFSGSTGFILQTKNKTYLFTDFRYILRAKNTIKKNINLVDITKMWKNTKALEAHWQSILKENKIKTLGLEEENLTVTRYKKFIKISKIKGHKIKFKNISGEVEKLREIKTSNELLLIKESQKINEKILVGIKKIIQKSLRTKKILKEIDLVWEIKKLAHLYKAEDISFEPIVAFGKNSASPHHLAGDTILKKGNLIMIDMGVKYKNYCSDMTRMFFTTSPTPLQEKIYNLVLEAQLSAIKNIHAGITGKKADSFARKIIKKNGYKENFGHGSGHGIGLDIHENPSLSEKYNKPLKQNSVITIEPGIYIENEFGVRIEDMLIVKKSNVEIITKANKDIKSSIIL
ncbi:MAG: aminopeptidase P family protein [Candidatus Gracilibacteria bacterium]|jgi:Xaa-Pro aminopeptidase